MGRLVAPSANSYSGITRLQRSLASRSRGARSGLLLLVLSCRTQVMPPAKYSASIAGREIESGIGRRCLILLEQQVFDEQSD